MFVKILYSLLFLGTGLALLKYRRNVFEWTGRWGWAEKYLGNGGTLTALALLGLALLALSVAYPLGAFDSLGSTSNGKLELTSPIH